MPSRKKTIETENDVKDEVKKWFDARKAWHYAPVQNGMGKSGIHDRVGCVPVRITPEMVGRVFGLFVSVECKKPGRRSEPNRGMSPAQATNLREILEAGGVALVCDAGEDDFTVLNYLVPQEYASA